MLKLVVMLAVASYPLVVWGLYKIIRVRMMARESQTQKIWR